MIAGMAHLGRFWPNPSPRAPYWPGLAGCARYVQLLQPEPSHLAQTSHYDAIVVRAMEVRVMKLSYDRDRFAEMVVRCCAALGLTRTGHLPRLTAINKGNLQRALAEPKAGKRRRLTDEERRKVVHTLMDAVEKARLESRVGINRREFLALAGLATLPGAAPVSPLPPPDWEDWLREGLVASERGDHAAAQHLFELAQRLGSDIPGAASLALAHQAQTAIASNAEASAITHLLKQGFAQLSAPLLPLPEQEPGEGKIAQFLATPVERRAYAQLAKASAGFFQERQDYAKALAACRTLQTIGSMLDDPSMAATLVADDQHSYAQTVIQMNTRRAPVDARIASRQVTEPWPLWRAIDLFVAAEATRPWDDQGGKAYDLRGQGKALHLLELSERDARQRAKITAAREEAEQKLEQWIAEHPGFPGVRALATLDHGRREWDRGHSQAAADAFGATLPLAWQLRSPYLFVEAHARLAEILEHGAAPRQLVLDHRAAALAFWPAGMYAEDYQRVRAQLQRLNPQEDEIRRAWGMSNSPTALLRAMPGCAEADAVRHVRQELRA